MIRPLESTDTSVRRGWLTPPRLERMVKDILGPLALIGDGVRMQADQPGSVVIDARPADDVATLPFRVRRAPLGLQIQPGLVRTGADGSEWFLPPVAGLPMLGYPTLQILSENGYVAIRWSKESAAGAVTNLPWPILFVPEGERKFNDKPAEDPVLADLVLAEVRGFGEVIEQWREGIIEIY